MRVLETRAKSVRVRVPNSPPYAPLAQLVELYTFNVDVLRSSRRGRTRNTVIKGRINI